jgi:predicted site-specific integrase-resolvase
VEEICEMLGVGRSTLYRYLSEGDGKEAAAEPDDQRGPGRRGTR